LDSQDSLLSGFNMDTSTGLAPRILPWAPQQPLDRLMAALGTVPSHTVIRITGGCADMAPEDAQGVLDLFTQAFQGFDGLLLIGGTRMIYGNNPSAVLFGITEVGPAIRRANKRSFQLGVIPRTEHFRWHPEIPVLVVKQTEPRNGSAAPQQFTTIVHPGQDLVIAATTPLTKQEIWDDEVAFCGYLRETLVEYGDWQSVTLAYNGGGTTERELRADADRGWPVLIVNGSGRKCDELAADADFTRKANVTVCERTATSLRGALQRLDVIPRDRTGRRHLRPA
jgi:hypothetical protein